MGRYDRQLKVFGEDGQRRISEAKVGIVGCGGLGTNVATALSVAGVRSFVISDPDFPEESNLNRQYVYCQYVGPGIVPRPKAAILAEWMRSLNPEIVVDVHVRRFTEDTSMYDDCDVLVDCLDSIGGRMELNRYAMSKGMPLVHGAIDGFTGEVATCIPGRTPCLRCMLGNRPEPKATPASIGAVVSTIGSMEATEVLKVITGRACSAGVFLSMDLETSRFSTVRFDIDPNCPDCQRP